MLINELKAMSLNTGDTFTMSADLGKFAKGIKVTVQEIKFSGNDVIVSLSDNKGNSDIFYFDKDDEV